MNRSHSIFWTFLISALIIIIYFKFKAESSTYLFGSNENFEKINTDNLIKLKTFHHTLKQSEKKFFSQNGEDGVLLLLAEFIKKTNKGYYVEFGASNGAECNTRYLREKYEWTGLLMDGYRAHAPNPLINLRIETILHSNILGLFEKYKVSFF
jgi:hypothetical protein